MRAAGLDLSITATAVAHSIDPADVIGCTHLIKTSNKGGDSRLEEIANHTMALIEGSEMALIEGFGFGSMKLAPSGMVHGAVRLSLMKASIPYATIPPSNLKKYATGSGNAGKPEMAVAAFKRAGVEFTDDNQCDAWWCWVALMDHLGQPVFSLPSVQRESLKKISMEWVP